MERHASRQGQCMLCKFRVMDVSNDEHRAAGWCEYCIRVERFLDVQPPRKLMTDLEARHVLEAYCLILQKVMECPCGAAGRFFKEEVFEKKNIGMLMEYFTELKTPGKRVEMEVEEEDTGKRRRVGADADPERRWVRCPGQEAHVPRPYCGPPIKRTTGGVLGLWWKFARYLATKPTGMYVEFGVMQSICCF